MFRDDAVDVIREAPRAMERLRESVVSEIGIETGATGAASRPPAPASGPANVRALASAGVQIVVVFF